MREKLQKFESRVAAVEALFLSIFLAVLLILAVAQVGLRFLHTGISWADTFLKQLVMWTGFLGAALAAAEEKNFAWEAAGHAVPARCRPILRLIASGAGLVVCILLFGAAQKYLTQERTSGAALMEMGSFSVPSWWAAAGIPIGFALMSLHFAFKCVDALLESIGP